ncbi:MAG TPA: zinc metalloprotease HtpX [Candidatus Babeliaceae bacterium]|nr:zinc metalloprotease HtpX [Candidatus Babeliaceae bacterium]
MLENRLKTVILLATLSGLLMALGGFLGGTHGIIISFIISLVMNFVTYFYSDKMVLKLYKAQPLDAGTYSWIYSMVQELSTQMAIPMPTLWLISTPMANAFATGRNPQHASVAVTSGILSLLNQRELRGVLAHELSHVKNRDILVSTIAATLATAIGFIANMMQNMFLWQSLSSNQADRQRQGNTLGTLFVALIMPIAATLLQLAISRSREYLADESGAYICQDPLALASALEKLQSHIPEAHLRNNDTLRASTGSLFIVNPFLSQGIMALFATHPPMNSRISRLNKIYEKLTLHKRQP